MEEDKTLFTHNPPVSWLPSIWIGKSATRKRWTVMLCVHSHYVPYAGYDRTFSWFLVLRLWWPPIWFYRGWVSWE